MTHAFFKALLFLAAGSVIQPGDLDMRLIMNGREREVLIAEQKPYWRPSWTAVPPLG